MNKTERTSLVLKNGREFPGLSFGAEKSSWGEVVFNTAMTGYPESITDPSYRGQILVLTYPLVGNYGVPDFQKVDGLMRHYESEEIHIRGLVISDYTEAYSHWNAVNSLGNWLKERGIPGIYGVDTRELTRLIRENGAETGGIIFNDNSEDPELSNHPVEEVSCREPRVYGNGRLSIALVDCGVKHNIIRSLVRKDTKITRVPWDYDFSVENYDGIFLSNGPGDPMDCTVTIENLRKQFKKNVPVFGICLGSQIMALAAGAETYKLKYGHRGHNQPVLLCDSTKAFISSQNHGYAVKAESLPENWKPWFINLNDNTCEGIIHKTRHFYSVQFHPEASGGPTDTRFLFNKFIDDVKKVKKERGI